MFLSLYSSICSTKKAVVEHSIRLSYHNELRKSEVSGECSPKTTIKHRPGSTALMNPECTQSGAIYSKDLPLSKHMSKLCHETQTTMKKSLIVGSEKMIEDKTQLSLPSMDLTQLTTTSEEYDKESSKTLTESTMESKEQNNAKNALLNLEHSKISPETLILNITMSKESDVAQSNSKRQHEVEKSGNGTNHTSITEDSKQSGISPSLSVQPG
ncbi:hypothetical protein DINM_001530 [Dirofilaria immitis]|nr:hypothetical protein [Dirofilaria immitis]